MMFQYGTVGCEDLNLNAIRGSFVDFESRQTTFLGFFYYYYDDDIIDSSSIVQTSTQGLANV